MPRTRWHKFVTVKSLIQVQGQKFPTMVHDTSSGGSLPTCQIWKTYLERQKRLQPGHDLLRTQGPIWPWGQNSRLKITNNGMRHIVWRWSTYIPNMKSLSWTTKKLQPGNELLRMQGPIWPWGQNSRSRSPTMVCKTSSGGGLPTCQIWKACLERQKSYSPDTICYGRTDQFDLEVKVQGHQQWYATHRLEVVYLHAKYEKPVLNDKIVTARTRFAMDARTSLTLRSKVTNNGTRHIVWRWSTYMPNMQSLSWTTKSYSPDTICYRRTDWSL
jgi:hypothetical protein